jgi:putative flippase GtrA
MSPIVRFARFNIVGALGIGVQLGTVAALAHGLGVNPIAATAVGIGAAVVHNFAWHVRWTWRDRMPPGRSRLRAFGRFVAANGAVSFVGSMALMPVLVGALAPVPANLVTIAACGLGNYFFGGRVCFPQVFHSSKPTPGVGFRGSFGNRLPRPVLTCGKPV